MKKAALAILLFVFALASASANGERESDPVPSSGREVRQNDRQQPRTNDRTEPSAPTAATQTATVQGEQAQEQEEEQLAQRFFGVSRSQVTFYRINNSGDWKTARNKVFGAYHTEGHFSTWYTDPGSTGRHLLIINGDISVDGAFEADSSKNAVVGLTGTGSLRLTEYGKPLLMVYGQTLIIDGDITLHGLQGRDNFWPVVYCKRSRDNPDSKIELRNGTITGGRNNQGGGVWVDNGTFIMSGGAISGNNANSYGGGVYVSNYAIFTMTGGTISGNTAKDGGGMYFVGDTLTISGGTISGNTAERGGGIYYAANLFVKTGGIIQGNTAKNGNTFGHSIFYNSASLYRDTALGANDNIKAEYVDSPTGRSLTGMPTASGQTLNGWTKK